MTTQVSPEILAAYQQREVEMSLRNSRIGCVFGIVAIPAFTFLDRVVYPNEAREFLWVRLLCAGLLAVAFWLFGTRLGRSLHTVQGTVILMVPAVAFLWMIYRTTGSSSSYYAGLNLLLLVLAIVLRWTFWQSLTSVALMLFLYLLTCWKHGSIDDHQTFLNNSVFLACTGVFIAIGSYFQTQLRLSEFASNYQLDKSRAELAAQNRTLEDTLRQLKETESQLVQTEKIVSLGRLSAGLIHEINNPLNYAATGLYVLRHRGAHLATDSPEEFAEVVRDINDGVERVKNIVSDLRSFSHPDAGSFDEVRVRDVITSSLRFMGNEWKERVSIESDVPEELLCLASKNKLTQVVVNLIQNALDALKAAPNPTEPPRIVITAREERGRVLIRVRDNGEGIEPQNLAKIFDPFFTTRDVGKGMGMGLSICYRILQEHRGSISVQSERGRYCEFIVELPSARAGGEAKAA